MQQRFGFSKGMRQSISPNKADNDSYYEAMNKRIIVDNTSATGALTDEPGTKQLVSVPTIKPLYTVELIPGVAPNSTLTFVTSGGTFDVIINCASDINLVYNTIMADGNIIATIAGEHLYIGLKGGKITVLFLTDTTNLIQTGVTLNVTEVVPYIAAPEIIAYGNVRDTLIIFTRSGTYGQIWKCQYNTDGTVKDAAGGFLVRSKHLVYSNVLFPDATATYTITDIVGRYDNENLIKIYWSNSVDELSHLNIADPDRFALDTTLLSITPDVDFSIPVVNSVISGGLYQSGMVQYGYQLYNLDGAETVISPLTGLIHLTDESESASNALSYKGLENGKLAGKAVSVTVSDIDANYDYIKIIAVYFTSEEGEPEVNIIHERSIPSSRSVTVIDNGDTVLSVYSPAQLNYIGSRTFSPKLLAVKDNLIVAGNIQDKYFDVDEVLGYHWDARTYRYKAFPGVASQVKYEGGAYEVVDTNFKISGSNVPETHDAHLAKEDQRTYKYRTDGTTMGGSGSKISYKFITRPLLLDNDSSDIYIQSPLTTASRQKWGSFGTTDFIEVGYSNNASYSSYASPINHSEVVGYQRDEVYRFGIVFFDGKGRQSFVKWIGDIKMPAITEEDGVTVYLNNQLTQAGAVKFYDTYFSCVGGTGIYANTLGIHFDVNTTGLPADWKFQIVRARREDVDKTIVSQGFVNCGYFNTFYSAVQQGYTLNTLAGMTSYNDPGNAAAKGILFFKSPEVVFNNDSIMQGTSDRLDFIARVSYGYYEDLSGGIPTGKGRVLKSNGLFTRYTTHSIVKDIQDGIKATPAGALNGTFYVVDTAGTTKRVVNYNYKDNAEERYSLKGSAQIVGLADLNDIAVTNIPLVNYERNLVSQYGGFSYLSKQNTVYIPAGKLRVCGGATTSKVFGGDTFIEFFDYMDNFWDATNSVPIGEKYKKYKEAMYIPVETTINLAMRHDLCQSRNSAIWDESKLQETTEVGFQVWDGVSGESASFGAYPAFPTDLYLYNRVYSKQATAKNFTGEPLNFRALRDRDCLVTNSEKHITGELIDSWTKFLFNNTQTVNSAYGGLSKLLTYRNQVLFWQPQAFGILSVNDRKMISDANAGQLLLGVGAVLEYYQYVSEKSGTSYGKSVVDSGAGIYYYDDLNRKLMMTQGGQEQSISDIADCAPLFKNITGLTGVIGVFDKTTRRVLHTFNADTDTTTGFNERLQAFESKYSFIPSVYYAHDGKLLATPSGSKVIYEHNDPLNPNEFYGGAAAEGYIKVMAGDDVKAVFTNVEYNSVSHDGTTEYPLDTFDAMQLGNSYRSSAKITLDATNLRRRFRSWRIQLPRDAEGMRYLDTYLSLTLYNTPVNNSTLRLEDITVYSLIPML